MKELLMNEFMKTKRTASILQIRKVAIKLESNEPNLIYRTNGKNKKIFRIFCTLNNFNKKLVLVQKFEIINRYIFLYVWSYLQNTIHFKGCSNQN